VAYRKSLRDFSLKSIIDISPADLDNKAHSINPPKLEIAYHIAFQRSLSGGLDKNLFYVMF